MWLDAFHARVKQLPGRVAFHTDRGACSYGELADLAARWANRHAVSGTRHLVIDNHPLDTLVQLLGCWTGGATAALVHHSTPAAVVADLRKRLSLPILRPDGTGPEDAEALIMTTSGTGGLPKLAVLAHRSIAVNSAAVGKWYAQPSGSHLLVGSTLSRAAGMSPLLVALVEGWTTHAFAEGTPFGELQGAIRERGITVLASTSSFYRLFLRYAAERTFPSVRHVRVGGEPAGPLLLQQLAATFPNARIFVVYGITEAGWRVTHLEADDPRILDGGVGFPIAHVECKVRPVEGVEAPVGELLIRGPAVFLGYLGAHGAYEGLEEGGWYPTRDLVRIDAQGCTYHLGRKDSLIKTGGFLVNPAEIEHVLRTLPGVADARCVAQPHPLLGSEIVADVNPGPGAALDLAMLRQGCQDRLEDHQVPREFRIRDQLPRTSAGKTARGAVKSAGQSPQGPVDAAAAGPKD